MLLSRKKERQMLGVIGKVYPQFSDLPENSGPD